jgi:hypothetical protein
MAVIATALLALTGCGDDSSESRRPLSQHQFDEIERLYRAQVAATGRSQGDMTRAAAATRRACRRVDRDDRLLAAMVASCDEVVAFVDSMTSLFSRDCSRLRECAPLVRKAVERLDEVLAGLDETERVVDQTVGEDACRRALTTPKLRQVMQRMRDGMDEVATAMASDDQKAVEKAGQRFIEAASEYESASNVGPVFRRFRQACAPRP